jgi:NAD-dependent dihydropyrimidine dehydrogenase PreA subunit
MFDYPMDDLQFANPFTAESEGVIPSGYFTDVELRAFSLLIHRRRSLPIYFGDCWRCYLCTFECFDFFDIVDHILKAHGPEPFNEADEADLEEPDHPELD